MSPAASVALAASLAFVITLVLTPVVRAFALRRGSVREVSADRWHRQPTPAVGGVAIFAGFAVAVATALFWGGDALRPVEFVSPFRVASWSPRTGLLLAAFVVFLVGVVDDAVRLRPASKLVGQSAAAVILLASGFGLSLTGHVVVDGLTSLLWFVGITNALNLLDNMDGVAAGVAAIAATYLGAAFVLEGQWGLAVLAASLAAALLGFLAHNYPPARIFMGDSGSLFLGLLLSGLALAPAPGGSRSLVAVLAAPVLILGVPILDTTVVTIGRLLEGRPVSVGGRDHTTHRFVAMGIPERRTVWLLWSVAAAGGGIGVALRTVPRGTALLLGGVLVGVLALVGAYLLSIRLQTLERENARPRSFYKWMIRSQSSYPVFALLLDGVWVTLAYYASYVLRWNVAELPRELPYFERTLVVFVGVKLVTLLLSGIYDVRWSSFGLFDGLRVVRANLFASLAGAVALLLLERLGLSRGVLLLDFFVCTLLTTSGRLSFRMLEGTARHWSDEGSPVVILGTEADARLAVGYLAGLESPRLRPVAIAVLEAGSGVARIGALPLYGGADALRTALAETGATAVVVTGAPGNAEEAAIAARVEAEGGIDAYRLKVSLTSMGTAPD